MTWGINKLFAWALPCWGTEAPKQPLKRHEGRFIKRMERRVDRTECKLQMAQKQREEIEAEISRLKGLLRQVKQNEPKNRDKLLGLCSRLDNLSVAESVATVTVNSLYDRITDTYEAMVDYLVMKA